jgi:hypothetical protein
MNKFTFDGVNKIFIVNSGITSIDVQIDLYSDWKEVLLEDDNMKYLQALSTVGGDPLTAGRFLGDTYFLENGWKIRPFEGQDHVLNIEGNLFSRDGSGAVVPTTGNSNVLVEMFVSNLVDTTIAESASTDFVQALKDSDWTHSSGTQSANFEDAITTILSMANGRIVNSSSGVFDFYDQDNSSIIFTLTESGLERVRQ